MMIPRQLPAVMFALAMAGCSVAPQVLSNDVIGNTSFFGTARTGGLAIPIQGGATLRGGSLRFAVTTVQGTIIGIGTVSPDGNITVNGARDRRLTGLVEKIATLCIQYFEPSTLYGSGWKKDAGAAAYADGSLSITFRRHP